QDVDRRRLARAVGAQEGEDRAAPDGERHVVQDGPALVALGEVPHLDGVRGLHGAHPSPRRSATADRAIRTSPKAVRARTWTVSDDGPGSSTEVRRLRTRPNLVTASIQAAVPSLTPISSPPAAVSMVTVPRATWPSRMVPLAVFTVTSRPASSMAT